MTQHEIIDFHTHPFDDPATNICSHQTYLDMTAESTVHYLQALGISRICGSVLCRNTPEAAPTPACPFLYVHQTRPSA
ncbi:MAG: hypothetical protein IJ412_06530 [Oscillospiraceae bacterium]|nr:hypothetical protein [Oscillospiraceae bacterium]